MKGRPSKVALQETQFLAAQSSVNTLIDTIKKTRQWDVYCIKATDANNDISSNLVSNQIALLNLRELAAFLGKYAVDFHSPMLYDDFLKKYGALVSTAGASKAGYSSAEQVKQFISGQWWADREVCYGGSMVYLSLGKWRWIESAMKRIVGDTTVAVADRRSIAPSVEQGTDWERVRNSYLKDDDTYSEADSQIESEYGFVDEARRRSSSRTKTEDIELGSPMVQKVGPREIIEKEEDLTCSRKCWTCCTWGLTWWVPGFCLGWCGMKRPDIRMAWREKVALCIIIATMCLSLLFFIIGLRYVICPPVNVLTQSEIQELIYPRVGSGVNPWFSAYGRYYYADTLMESHKKSYGAGSGPGALANYIFDDFYGQDVSRLFFRQDSWDYYCPGIEDPGSDFDNMDSNLRWQDRTQVLSQFRNIHRSTAPNGLPQLYVDNLFQYTKGKVGWSMESIKAISSDTKVNFFDLGVYCIV